MVALRQHPPAKAHRPSGGRGTWVKTMWIKFKPIKHRLTIIRELLSRCPVVSQEELHPLPAFEAGAYPGGQAEPCWAPRCLQKEAPTPPPAPGAGSGLTHQAGPCPQWTGGASLPPGALGGCAGGHRPKSQLFLKVRLGSGKGTGTEKKRSAPR